MSLDRLRPLVDLPALSKVLTRQDEDGVDTGALLRWYDAADSLVKREVRAGRASTADSEALQAEIFDLMREVPGLQLVTNEPFGVPDDDA